MVEGSHAHNAPDSTSRSTSRSTPHITRRSFTAAASATALIAALAACTEATTPTPAAKAPDPATAASNFAAALGKGDLTGVPIRVYSAAQANTQIKEALSALSGTHPTVKVAKMGAADSLKTSATLAVTWDLTALLPAGAAAAESIAKSAAASPSASGATPAKDPAIWEYTTEAELLYVNGDWAVTWNINLLMPKLNGTNRLTRVINRPERASILGDNDQPLVMRRKVYQIGIDKTQVAAAGQPASAAALAALLKIDPVSFATQVKNAGPKQFVVGITLRQDVVGDLLDKIAAIPGAIAPSKELDLAPTSSFAAPILGRVGEATAEMISASNGVLKVGDYTGLSGLQLRYNGQLTGKPGIDIVLDNNPEATAITPAASGAPVSSASSSAAKPVNQPINKAETVFTIAAVPGAALRTSLNENVQTYCEALLAKITNTPSGIVAIKPSTGEIIAAASGPGSQGYSTATVGQYAPGSTFKVASTLAVLRKGLTLESPVACPATIIVDGREFKNDDGYPPAALGTQPLANVVKYSCNTGFVNLGQTATQADLVAAGGSLGFAQTNVTGVPAYFGNVPAQASATLHAASMFGQGQILASPLTMATVAASVSKGATVAAKLVRDLPAAAPNASKAAAPVAAVPLAGPESATLRTAMQNVVQGGTASILADVPAPVVGAKTGTAQYGAATPPKVHAWMIAYHGDFAACVFVEEGDYGAVTSGPIMNALLKQAPSLLASTAAAPAKPVESATPVPDPVTTSPSASSTPAPSTAVK